MRFVNTVVGAIVSHYCFA